MGTYVIPYIEGHVPFGGCNLKKGLCDACEKENDLSMWLTHTVYQTDGSSFTKVSHYCGACYEFIEPLVRSLWVPPTRFKTCVLL